MAMKMIHATPEQTNLILRSTSDHTGKRKKHMKNNKKNTINSSPSIVLYPSPQWKKRSEHEQAKYHDRMKNNKSFNKKKKNMIYNGNTLSEAKKSLIGKFPRKYMDKFTPTKYNEYIDKYGSWILIDELNNIKDLYLNYYNNKTKQYKEKHEKIMINHNNKKELKEEISLNRFQRYEELNNMMKGMKEDGNIYQREKKLFEKNKLSYVIHQCNQFYTYKYVDGVKVLVFMKDNLAVMNK